MDQTAITEYIAATFQGVDVVRAEERGGPEIAWGDTFFIYDPKKDAEPKLQFPFATIVTKDYGDFDNASNLNRPGIYRLNIGVGRETFRSMFESNKSENGEAPVYDFTALDSVVPHPVYGAQYWICVLNPGDETFQHLAPHLREAYEIAVKRFNKIRARRSHSR